jgi:hypothetical protein
MTQFRQWVTWTAVGVLLDATYLITIWLLLNAIGPIKVNLAYWLDAVGLVSTPWLIHVVVLPRLFRVTRADPAVLLIRTAVFLGLAALIIPIVGTSAYLFAILPVVGTVDTLAHGTAVVGAAPIPPLGWVDRPIECAAWTAMASIVGVAIGFLLHATRPEGSTDDLPPSSPNYPRMRSDVLGGMIGALLAFSTMFLALPLGIYTRPTNISGDWMHNLSVVPQLATALVIGILALLPHLILVGRDTIATEVASLTIKT